MERKNIEINPLLDKYSEYIKKINNALDSELNLYSESEFKEPLKYALYGGKRIRPIILLLSSECAGKIDDNTLAAACAIEFLHTESVIHDDIIDKQDYRRGKETFHKKYGLNFSILTADFVFGMILDIAAQYSDQRVSQELSVAALKMCEGEIREIQYENLGNVGWNTYKRIIEEKTAALFQTSARIGAIIGGGNQDEIEIFGRYALNLGIAYQMKDDLLDWMEDERLTDLFKNKISKRDLNNEATEFMNSSGLKLTSLYQLQILLFKIIHLQNLYFPFFKNIILHLGLFFIPFAIFIIVGSSNAVNLTDGLDGLATVPVMLVALSFTFICYVVGNTVFSEYLQIPYIADVGESAIFCGSIVGSCLGFLWFNAPPAKIFMGDSGSYLFGSLVLAHKFSTLFFFFVMRVGALDTMITSK